VVMPVLSLKFLDDLCTAYAWLQINGYGIETISEYTAMLAYKDFPQGRYPPPLRALQIPPNALQDTKVDELALGHFVTARTFILLHELGHVYYQHRWDTLEQSRTNEEQADRFAAQVMDRTPLPPLGMLVFFMADAHWSSFPVTYSENEWREQLRKERTHPLTGQRLHTLATQLRDRDLAGTLDQLAKLLDDPETQASIVASAKASDESILRPRRPRELPRLTAALPTDRAERLAFDGRYLGESTQNGVPESFPVEVIFQRTGNAVTGRYVFGLGVGQIKGGTVEGDTLHFSWQWSGNYGRAALRATEDGSAFSGTWGYRESESNAGAWSGRRREE
jgi:Peptidase U49